MTAELRTARVGGADAPDETLRQVVAIRLAAELDARSGGELDLLRVLVRADQIELEIKLACAQAVVSARRGQLRHHAERGRVTVRRCLGRDVELRADPRVADAGAPALVDQVILRLAVARDRHEVGIDAARAERAEDLDAIGRAEREHAADVGDVAESFAPIEIHELYAAAPLALGQRLARRDKPDSGVTENGVSAGSAVLRQRGNGEDQAQH